MKIPSDYYGKRSSAIKFIRMLREKGIPATNIAELVEEDYGFTTKWTMELIKRKWGEEVDTMHDDNA